MSHIIKRVLVTEKAGSLAERSTYVFEVARSAGKAAVKDHVERYFNVKALSVRTAVCRRRPKRSQKHGRKGPVRYWKKAFVRLREGEKISSFEGN